MALIIATVRGIQLYGGGRNREMDGNKEPGDAAIRKDFPRSWQDLNNAFIVSGRTPIQK
jgi:hypothetical protein